MSYFSNASYAILCLCYGHLLNAQDSTNEERRPFTLTGRVTASANFYSSNETIDTRPSFNWNTNGDFTGKINQLTLPFSFVINQYHESNSSPYFQMGISPTYKWATLHLGDRYISFSPFTFDGQNFRGVGIELNPKLLRFAAFYGKLNRAVNEDTAGGYDRFPQYASTGYGVKLGVGNSSRFIDLVYFHAKEDSSSASFINPKFKNPAMENAVVGTSFKLTLLEKITWTGDLAISGLIPDLSSDRIPADSSSQAGKKFMNKFLSGNPTTVANYAGQTSVYFYASDFNTGINYKRVQPDFKSLGTPYMLNDIELISWINNFSAIKRKLNISTTLARQHNNLRKMLTSEMSTWTGSLNVNARLTEQLNFNLNYSGSKIAQLNDRNQLPDSLRLQDSVLLKQQMSQFSGCSAYTFTNGDNNHCITGSVNLSIIDDKNPATSQAGNSNNFSSSLNYRLTFLKKGWCVSLSGLYSKYRQMDNAFTSVGPTLGMSAQLLKNKNLNVQGNFGYLFTKFNTANTQKNMTYSLSTGYQAKKHVLNLSANYVHTPANPISNVIDQSIPYAVTTKNLAGGVSYTYSF